MMKGSDFSRSPVEVRPHLLSFGMARNEPLVEPRRFEDTEHTQRTHAYVVPNRVETLPEEHQCGLANTHGGPLLFYRQVYIMNCFFTNAKKGRTFYFFFFSSTLFDFFQPATNLIEPFRRDQH